MPQSLQYPYEPSTTNILRLTGESAEAQRDKSHLLKVTQPAGGRNHPAELAVGLQTLCFQSPLCIASHLKMSREEFAIGQLRSSCKIKRWPTVQGLRWPDRSLSVAGVQQLASEVQGLASVL